MKPESTRLIIFTDLDGCLLNKHDYDWSAAASTLSLLRQRKIPLILNSSKTVSEMLELSEELGMAGGTLISENGSVIRWGSEHVGREASVEVVGAMRAQILGVLGELKSRFQFRSFEDLGVSGVMDETQLPEHKARLALSRQGTEPMLWDDTEQQLDEFEQSLASHGLTLTRGGRFWHIAGNASKGDAMQRVVDFLVTAGSNVVTSAIGDSPIDQSMLDVADIPIGIPTANGLGVQVDSQRGIVATQLGAAGWAEAVSELLSRIDRF